MKLRTLFLLALLCLPQTLAGQKLPDDLKAWERRVEKLDAKLRAKDWAGAHAAAREALEEALTDHFMGRDFLGRVVGRLAVAEAGLGRHEDALWHWQTALNLSGQPVPKEDLAKLGAAGELLSSQTRRRLDEIPAGLDVQPAGAPGVEPARKVAGELPEPSKVLQAITVPKWLRLQAVIDAEGRLRSPVVVTPVPEMIWEVLEAARSWRFEPGRKDGVPVATFYELVVHAPADKPLTQIAQLHGDLAALEAVLRAGRWEEARSMGEATWTRALERAEPSTGFLAVAMMLRALAAAATGAQDEAICLWQGAQALVPALFHVDLSAYGEAGALLEAYRWGRRTAEFATREPADAPPAIEGELSRPKLLERGAQPQYTEAARRAGTRGTIVLNMIIDESGALREPWVARNIPESRGLEASALDAVCRWRFQPASRGGRPVAVYYTLSVSFEHAGVPANARRAPLPKRSPAEPPR
jgi:TonB family protein